MRDKRTGIGRVEIAQQLHISVADVDTLGQVAGFRKTPVHLELRWDRAEFEKALLLPKVKGLLPVLQRKKADGK